MTSKTRSAVAPALIFVVALLAGCAGASSAPTPTALTASPTSTPATLVVAPGEMPPLVAGGDCSQLITLDQLTALLDVPLTHYEAGDPGGQPSVSNLGGLICSWWGDGPSGYVQVIPEAQLAGAALPASMNARYFDRCTIACHWEGTRAGYRILVSVGVTQQGQQPSDAPLAQIADVVSESLAAPPSPDWVRDRAGWWPALDCTSLASGAADQLGQGVSGKEVGYVDAPPPGLALADIASDVTQCSLSLTADGSTGVIVATSPGMAWNVPTEEPSQPMDLGVPGITAYRVGPLHGVDHAVSLADGVNGMDITLNGTPGAADDPLVRVLAQLAARGFPGSAAG